MASMPNSSFSLSILYKFQIFIYIIFIDLSINLTCSYNINFPFLSFSFRKEIPSPNGSDALTHLKPARLLIWSEFGINCYN